MICTNKVSYYIASGWDYKEVLVKCGTTDPHGGRALCEHCEKVPSKLAEHNSILENSAADNEWLASAGWGEM